MDKISSSGFTIVQKEGCKYCHYSGKLLDEEDIPYVCVDKSLFTDDELVAIRPESHKTYPMIYKDREFIGGFMELRRFINNHKKQA